MTGLERLFFYRLHRLSGVIVLLSRFVRLLTLILLRLWLIVMQMHRISRPPCAIAADDLRTALLFAPAKRWFAPTKQ